MVSFENLFQAQKAWLKKDYLLRTSNQPFSSRRRTGWYRGVPCDTVSWLQRARASPLLSSSEGCRPWKKHHLGVERLGKETGNSKSLETKSYYFATRPAHKWRKAPSDGNADVVIGLGARASSEMRSPSALAPASIPYSSEIMTTRTFLEHNGVHTRLTTNESTPRDRFRAKCEELDIPTIAREVRDEENLYCRKQEDKSPKLLGFLESLSFLII